MVSIDNIFSFLETRKLSNFTGSSMSVVNISVSQPMLVTLWIASQKENLQVIRVMGERAKEMTSTET